MVDPETELSTLLRFGNQDLMVTAAGTAEDFPKVHDWPPQSGVFFSAEHVKRYAQVVVLGQTVVTNLFSADTSPLGAYVLIGNAPFLVIPAAPQTQCTLVPKSQYAGLPLSPDVRKTYGDAIGYSVAAPLALNRYSS